MFKPIKTLSLVSLSLCVLSLLAPPSYAVGSVSSVSLGSSLLVQSVLLFLVCLPQLFFGHHGQRLGPPGRRWLPTDLATFRHGRYENVLIRPHSFEL